MLFLGEVLAAVGVYGVMGHMVMQRGREIRVRLALGARSDDVVRMVLRSGLRLTLPGVGAGLAGAVALSGILASFLFGVSSLDPLTYGAADARRPASLPRLCGRRQDAVQPQV